jgi:predicted DnaQ family exonuclease/DinG family helicase
MTPSHVRKSPFDQTYVSLDLETTGLNSDREEIIQIGAVKFRGYEILETFDSMVNPRRTISNFITQLTGITQQDVDTAPTFADVSEKLIFFLGGFPLIGHNIAFDIDFLSKAGLRIANPIYDTHHLASVFIPNANEYSLVGLTSALGIQHVRPHRALDDAQACQKLFLALVEKALNTNYNVIPALASISRRSSWPLGSLLENLEQITIERHQDILDTSLTDPKILHAEILEKRLQKMPALKKTKNIEAINLADITNALENNGTLSRTLTDYEYRPQQLEMAHAVTEALNNGQHLIVEAGTGVGKSIAYLLPSILFSIRNGQRIIISTNTINLQDQLINKDIPALLKGIENESTSPISDFQFTHLKGMGNYLCVRKWSHLAENGSLSSEDARMVSKVLVWLQETHTGDRSEINIPMRDSFLWDRVSASGIRDCDTWGKSCFLRAARARAEAAHIVVVNHALLLSDMASGKGLLPDYDHLIIDEAHHLEEVASRQLGFEIPCKLLEEIAFELNQRLEDIRYLDQRPHIITPTTAKKLQNIRAEVSNSVTKLRDMWSDLMYQLSEFLEHMGETKEQRNQLRITLNSRKQPGWSKIELQWEGFNESFLGTAQLIDQLLMLLEPQESIRSKTICQELRSWQERNDEIRIQIQRFIVNPDHEYVYWVTLSRSDHTPTLSSSPLNVGASLKEMLFDQKRTVIMTSATLSVNGSMQYTADRTGVTDAQELILGSPYDFKKAALILIPSDMPEPAGHDYQKSLQEAMIKIANSAKGGVLGLFTSHASLQITRDNIKTRLGSAGIKVLAQGIDGPVYRLLAAAKENTNIVLLGTNSLWEGVDLPGSLLQVLVLTRLPFAVPTEPLFAARSEQFREPFSEHAVPQAVLRFRQGFGRLIRNKNDRGVVIILDRRITSKPYGNTFLDSLPNCTIKETSLRHMNEEIDHWLHTSRY